MAKLELSLKLNMCFWCIGSPFFEHGAKD